MGVVGRVDGLWRYPVKSMAGEELDEAFVGFAGVYGDRIFAFRSSTSQKGFPYLTGREQEQMIRFRPRFRHPAKAARPVNLAEAEALAPGVTPLYADHADLLVDVETPGGTLLAIDDPKLVRVLGEGVGKTPELTLIRSDRGLTDCRPVSLISLQTVAALGGEVGAAVDKRRFRANLYVDLGSAAGFTEDGFIGRRVRIGSRAVLSILERDPRCKMITLDPDTAESNPKILRAVAQGHEGMAGVFGAVLVEGTIHRGDDVTLLD